MPVLLRDHGPTREQAASSEGRASMVRVIAEVSFSPIGTGTPSVGRYVAAALAVLREHPAVKYELNPMGTVLEGERKEIIDVIERMNEAIFAAGAQRVGTTLKIDERRDKPASMDHKVSSVLETLGPEDKD